MGAGVCGVPPIFGSRRSHGCGEGAAATQALFVARSTSLPVTAGPAIIGWANERDGALRVARPIQGPINWVSGIDICGSG